MINPGTPNCQFMVSSPYTNYDNGSCYDDLCVVSPELK